MAASAAWTSFWSLAGCCGSYLLRLCDYFLKAPAIPFPPPRHGVAGAAEDDSKVVEVQPRSFQFQKNQNRNRGNGGGGGRKY